MKKHYFLHLILIVISFSTIFCQTKTITILYTNDIHASFTPHEAYWVGDNPKPLVGGFLELNRIVDSIRLTKKNIILIDGGDVMTGNPIAEIKYKSAYGGALFEMMNIIGYEAWTIGNHDLDISQDNLIKLTHIASFPTLSANLVDTIGDYPLNNKPYIIITKNGLRVGIIGIMSDELFQLTNTNNLVGLKVLPSTEVLQNFIKQIDKETDLIIALTHQGFFADSILATKVSNLDVIIGSHSHTRLKSPKVVNGILICQTGANCENLGELELTIENDKISSFNGKLHTLWVKKDYPQTKLSKLVDEFKKIIDKEYSEVIGKTKVDLKRSRSGESTIGHFITDAIREKTGADIALTNSSGIRKDIPAGDIKKIDLFEVSPFRNYLCTFPLTGKEIYQLTLKYLNSLVNGRTSIELSGLKCTWEKANGNLIIKSLKIGEEEIKETKTYTVATIDYVINQADKYLEFTPKNVSNFQILLYEALIEKVQKDKIIDGTIENRFQEIIN